MNVTFLRRAILGLLKEAKPYALPEGELLIRLDNRAGKPVGIHNFTIHLGWLWEQRMIQKLDGAFGDEEARWVITNAGLAELAS